MRKNPFDPKATNEDKETSKYISHLFKEIFEYADDNPNFNLEFVDSVYEQFEKNGTLSEKQYTAIENIYENWVCS